MLSVGGSLSGRVATRAVLREGAAAMSPERSPPHAASDGAHAIVATDTRLADVKAAFALAHETVLVL